MINQDLTRQDDLVVQYDANTEVLTIHIKLDPEGTPSKNSGKMMMLGSSHGWRTVDADSTLAISLNVGRKPYGKLPTVK